MPATRTGPKPWYLWSTRGLLAWVAWLAVASGTTVLLLRFSPRARDLRFQASRYARSIENYHKLASQQRTEADEAAALADAIARGAVYDHRVWEKIGIAWGRSEPLLHAHPRLKADPTPPFPLSERERTAVVDQLTRLERIYRAGADHADQEAEESRSFQLGYERAAEYPWADPPTPGRRLR